MNDNEFFQELGQQWQQEKSLPEITVEKALRAQRLLKIKHYFHMALSISMLVVAVYFLWVPFSIITGAASLTLMAAVVVDWYYIIRFRKPITNWVDWSPAGLLRYHQALLRAEITSAKYCVLSSLGLLVFTAFVWGLTFFDEEFKATGFHYIFSAVSVPISLVFIFFYGNKLKNGALKKVFLHDLAKDQED